VGGCAVAKAVTKQPSSIGVRLIVTRYSLRSSIFTQPFGDPPLVIRYSFFTSLLDFQSSGAKCEEPGASFDSSRPDMGRDSFRSGCLAVFSKTGKQEKS
jgi:hypothetical protein